MISMGVIFVILRTDLAIETDGCAAGMPGIEREESIFGNVRVTRVTVADDNAAASLGKPKGRYITAEGIMLAHAGVDEREYTELIANELRSLLPDNEGTVLVVGLGNRDITPDALGPRCVERILATRHITGELKKCAGLSSLRSVAAVAPGVLGQTGIEAAELITALVGRTEPSAVIAVDALASRSLARLGTTVQLGDTGISPGGGIGSRRLTLNKENLGVPVIAVGVPTVVDAATLAYDILGGEDTAESRISSVIQGRSMFVTPKETDLLTERAARLIAMAINRALQPDTDLDTLMALVS